MFNGAAITVLALLTEWNVTTEALARWNELDALTSRVGIRVTPEIADRFGLTIGAIGAAVTAVGFRWHARPAGESPGRRPGLRTRQVRRVLDPPYKPGCSVSFYPRRRSQRTPGSPAAR